MRPAQVTIIMPVFNGATTLGRAVGSILSQTYSHWKLLILEDGSTDNTLSLAQSFEDARIQVISDGKHWGIVARLNQGIELIESPYIARMDADDVAYPDRLAKQLTFLETSGSAVVKNLIGSASYLVWAHSLVQKVALSTLYPQRRPRASPTSCY